MSYTITKNDKDIETAVILSGISVTSLVSSQPWYNDCKALLVAGKEAEAVELHQENLAAHTAASGTGIYRQDEEDDMFG